MLFVNPFFPKSHLFKLPTVEWNGFVNCQKLNLNEIFKTSILINYLTDWKSTPNPPLTPKATAQQPNPANQMIANSGGRIYWKYEYNSHSPSIQGHLTHLHNFTSHNQLPWLYKRPGAHKYSSGNNRQPLADWIRIGKRETVSILPSSLRLLVS